MQITTTLNGTEVTRDVEPRVLLVHYLREELGLTGTHWGCDTSNCGTCVVLMDGGVIADARVGLAAVGPNTTGLPAISAALRGQPPSEELYARAGELAAQSCEPATDARGTADYKRHLAGELTRRTVRRAVARISGEA